MQQEATPIKLKKIKDLGLFIDDDELYKHAKGIIPLEEEMAELILGDKRNDNNKLLLPYRYGNDRSDMPLINFFWDFFGFGKPCHVEIHYPSMPQIVDIIRENSGIPVIAHIGANIKVNHTEVINEMISVGVMGVEVFSSYHDKKLSDLLYDYSLSK